MFTRLAGECFLEFKRVVSTKAPSYQLSLSGRYAWGNDKPKSPSPRKYKRLRRMARSPLLPVPQQSQTSHVLHFPRRICMPAVSSVGQSVTLAGRGVPPGGPPRNRRISNVVHISRLLYVTGWYGLPRALKAARAASRETHGLALIIEKDPTLCPRYCREQ